MAQPVKSVLGGRYKLTGELTRGAGQRAWDRWLDRTVYINIFAAAKIDSLSRKRQFIDSAQAVARIDHPNVEALLDFGATGDGSPYHVMHEAGVELTPLARGERWTRARPILLDVIAGLAALHERRIVHGDLGRHAVVLVDGIARIVDFADAVVHAEALSPTDVEVDVVGLAALGFWLLTGIGATGRSPAALADALAQTRAPGRVKAALLRALTDPRGVGLAELREAIAGAPATVLGVPVTGLGARMLSVAAGVAASAMLSIGLWSSYASVELAREASVDRLACEGQLDVADRSPAPRSPTRSPVVATFAEPSNATPDEPGEVERAETTSRAEPRFESARARSQVGSEASRDSVTIRSQRFDLRRDLSPADLVQRGIDLTHGRPTPEDDPRLPILDGPERARALFEAACARDYGKGCHMLGVQIAEGMIADDGAGPAPHYLRGCELDYHRSCAALADLARAGQVDADVSMLEAKACLLAGPGSSFCAPTAASFPRAGL